MYSKLFLIILISLSSHVSFANEELRSLLDQYYKQEVNALSVVDYVFEDPNLMDYKIEYIIQYIQERFDASKIQAIHEETTPEQLLIVFFSIEIDYAINMRNGSLYNVDIDPLNIALPARIALGEKKALILKESNKE